MSAMSFLLNEIGEIVFEFNLEDAIKKVFFLWIHYIPLPYSDPKLKHKKKKII